MNEVSASGDTAGTFSGLLVDDEEPVRVASAHFEEVASGNGEKIRCPRNGLYEVLASQRASA